MTKENDKGFTVKDRRISAQSEESASGAEPAQDNEQQPTLSEPPAMDFSTLVLSLSTSALMYLGLGRDENSTEPPNLPLAKQTIDCIALLEEKTSGNLSGEEERLLSEILYDLRMRYLASSKAKS